MLAFISPRRTFHEALRALSLVVAMMLAGCGASQQANSLPITVTVSPAAAESIGFQDMQRLSRAYAIECEAMMRSDADALSQISTPTWISTSATGAQVGRREMELALKVGFLSGLKVSTCSVLIESANRNGDRLMVRTTTKETGSKGFLAWRAPITMGDQSIEEWVTSDGRLLEASTRQLASSPP